MLRSSGQSPKIEGLRVPAGTPGGQGWDEFPNGRFGDARSPAYGELDGYGAGLKLAVSRCQDAVKETTNANYAPAINSRQKLCDSGAIPRHSRTFRICSPRICVVPSLLYPGLKNHFEQRPIRSLRHSSN